MQIPNTIISIPNTAMPDNKMTTYLQRIFEEIDKDITGDYNQMYKVELKILMKTLSPKEKIIVAKYFVDIAWNIGSLSVLSMLQECGILSATEYILSQENKDQIQELEDHIQLVLSDFIEASFELLGNFLTNCEFSNNLKLKSFLEDCISRLLKDLEVNPNIITKNYLKEVKSIVLDSVYINFKILHLTCLLDLYKVNTRTAFNELDNWTSFISENSTLYEILKELIVNDTESLQKYLLIPSIDKDFNNWKYFVILLNIGTKFSNDDFSKTIRTHFKNLFKEFVSKMSKQLCLTLLITGRVFCSAYAEDDNSYLQKYTQWYKSIFSDMKYTITTTQFKDVMTVLNELIEFEQSPKFLKVHASTSISPATLCNEIVLQYKNNCRLKISSFKKVSKANGKNLDLNESIIIDDDDDD